MWLRRPVASALLPLGLLRPYCLRLPPAPAHSSQPSLTPAAFLSSLASAHAISSRLPPGLASHALTIPADRRSSCLGDQEPSGRGSRGRFRAFLRKAAESTAPCGVLAQPWGSAGLVLPSWGVQGRGGRTQGDGAGAGVSAPAGTRTQAHTQAHDHAHAGVDGGSEGGRDMVHLTEFQLTGERDGTEEATGQKDGRVGVGRRDMVLVLLNFDLPPFVAHLWDQAGALRICADGGANRLYDQLPRLLPQESPESVRERLIPDVIKGDLDSLRPDVRAFYQARGCRVYDMSEDQDTTDLDKCIQHILNHQRTAASQENSSSTTGSSSSSSRVCPVEQLKIVVVGALGGRIDHEFGNINVLHRYPFLRITLLSQYCQMLLLPAGRRHIIRPNRSFEGPHCGLIPVCQPARCTTTGLRWNLTNLEMAFGKLVSTSNQLAGDEVVVESNAHLLWTTELRFPSSTNH